MKLLSYTVKIKKISEGGFEASVPKLPGCLTWGKTYEEAVVMAKDAIEGFVEALAKAGQPIPVENNKISWWRRTITLIVPSPTPRFT